MIIENKSKYLVQSMATLSSVPELSEESKSPESPKESKFPSSLGYPADFENKFMEYVKSGGTKHFTDTEVDLTCVFIGLATNNDYFNERKDIVESYKFKEKIQQMARRADYITDEYKIEIPFVPTNNNLIFDNYNEDTKELTLKITFNGLRPLTELTNQWGQRYSGLNFTHPDKYYGLDLSRAVEGRYMNTREVISFDFNSRELINTDVSNDINLKYPNNILAYLMDNNLVESHYIQDKSSNVYYDSSRIIRGFLPLNYGDFYMGPNFQTSTTFDYPGNYKFWTYKVKLK